MTRHPRIRGRRAFTLVEMVITVVIIAVLAGLIFAALGPALRSARVTGERQFLASVKMGIEQFQNDFGFLPPLVNDASPTAGNSVNLRDSAFLSTDPGGTETRYSVRSLPYYILGTLGKDIDGVEGAGFTAVDRATGQFTRKGKAFEPLADVSRDRQRVVGTAENAVIVDRWGNAIRYYRWQPTVYSAGPRRGEVEEFRVPRVVGDVNADARLRSASFALLSLGPNQLTDERGPVPSSGTFAIDKGLAGDDILEVGP